LLAGRWHSVPFRVLAPHLCPGQSAPKRHSTPILTLPFAIIDKTPTVGIVIPNYKAIRKASDPASYTAHLDLHDVYQVPLVPLASRHWHFWLKSFHPRAKFDLPAPGTAMLSMKLQIDLGDGIGVQHIVGAIILRVLAN